QVDLGTRTQDSRAEDRCVSSTNGATRRSRCSCFEGGLDLFPVVCRPSFVPPAVLGCFSDINWTVRFRMAQLLDGAGKLSWVLLKSVLRFTFMFLNNCVAIPSYCLYLLLLQPLRICYSSAFWHIEGVMFKWLLAMVSSWGWISGYT
ncbi:hypothetical protein AMECASPLE_018846, partial [Ameca splendens]